MSIIKKFVSFIKKLFSKQNKAEILPEPKVVSNDGKKVAFADSLKVSPKKGKSSKKIETPICIGDGLGIQKKITY